MAAVAGGLALLAASPTPGLAQEAQSTRDTSGQAAAQEEGRYSVPPDSVAPETGLRFLGTDSLSLAPRAPFVYPLDGRRSPFRPPAARSAGGSAFGALTLSGIIYAPETGSVVVMVNRNTGNRHRLRVGDQVAGARLVEVGPDRAVFRVTGSGTSRRAVLRLRDSQERELNR